MHTGIGYGTVNMVLASSRTHGDYVIHGSVMKQIAIAVGLAQRGEIALSTEANTLASTVTTTKAITKDGNTVR